MVVSNLNIILIIIIAFIMIDFFIKGNLKVESFDESDSRDLSSEYNKGIITVNNINAKYFSLLPKGSVVLFHGPTVPAGWAICNGQRGTPNMMGRIPIGDKVSGALAGPHLFSSGSTAAAGNHSHTINKSSRSFLNSIWGAGQSRVGIYNNLWSNAAGNHSHTVTVNAASSIYPDRTTVMFIMKL